MNVYVHAIFYIFVPPQHSTALHWSSSSSSASLSILVCWHNALLYLIYMNLITANTVFTNFTLHKTKESNQNSKRWANLYAFTHHQKSHGNWTRMNTYQLDTVLMIAWTEKIAAQTPHQEIISTFGQQIDLKCKKQNKIKKKKDRKNHSVCSFICLVKSYGLSFCYANTVHFTMCECVCISFSNEKKLSGKSEVRKKSRSIFHWRKCLCSIYCVLLWLPSPSFFLLLF